MEIRRCLEHSARCRALAFCRWARFNGWTWHQCAEPLDLDARTLKDWQSRWDDQCLAPTPLGAPRVVLTQDQVRAVEDAILLFGSTGVGIRSLALLFPEIPRFSLQLILYGYRDRIHQIQRCGHYHTLDWKLPRAVWAMDYTFPGHHIDAVAPAIFTVRDLASRCILAFAPCPHADAATTIHHLDALFRLYGPPLVIKADNGTHFIAEEVRTFLAHHDVTMLLSPIYTPAFNGAVEADQGSLKLRAAELAARDGTPFQWSASHCEGARLWRNRETPAPGAVSPERAFLSAPAITLDQRRRFQFLLDHQRERIAAESSAALVKRHGSAPLNDASPDGDQPPADTVARSSRADKLHQHSLERRAVAEAMKAVGLYTTRRALVRLPDRRRERE